MELLKGQERQCGRRVPAAVGQAAWPCSLMGDEVICKGVILDLRFQAGQGKRTE